MRLLSPSLNLTPIQEHITLSLMGRPCVPVDQLMETIWPNPDTMPDQWNLAIKVHICNLRKKLAKTEWEITCAYGWGYRLAKKRDRV